jgi:hypothetical protein
MELLHNNNEISFFFIPVHELGDSRFSRLLLGNWGKYHAQRRIFFVMSQNMMVIFFLFVECHLNIFSWKAPFQ